MYVHAIYSTYHKSIVPFLKICKSKFSLYFNTSTVNIFKSSLFFCISHTISILWYSESFNEYCTINVFECYLYCFHDSFKVYCVSLLQM